MKLLIITQKVNKNDQILGFFHAWLEEFSKQVEQLTVVCLEEGFTSLPKNTKVYSLGKERGTSKLQQLQLGTKYVVELRDEYDAVFVHMNPLYIVLFGLFWKMHKKPVFLWYMHKHVDAKLRIAERFVETIFTGSEHSLRLETQKKMITGHGIDTDFFVPSKEKHRNEIKSIVTVGRVSSAKKTLEIIQAIKDVPDVVLHIVGGGVTQKDIAYVKSCTTFVAEHNLETKVVFHGPVAHSETKDFYQQADLFVNISNTGSLDKVLLEALACETPVITSNDAGKDIEGAHYFDESQDNLTQQITSFLTGKEKLSAREYVKREHGLQRLIKKIVERMSEALK